MDETLTRIGKEKEQSESLQATYQEIHRNMIVPEPDIAERVT
jgi:hypothetical protein